jgi:hypothetical protein
MTNISERVHMLADVFWQTFINIKRKVNGENISISEAYLSSFAEPSALSLEEKRLLESLDRLNERLKGL